MAMTYLLKRSCYGTHSNTLKCSQVLLSALTYFFLLLSLSASQVSWSLRWDDFGAPLHCISLSPLHCLFCLRSCFFDGQWMILGGKPPYCFQLPFTSMSKSRFEIISCIRLCCNLQFCCKKTRNNSRRGRMRPLEEQLAKQSHFLFHGSKEETHSNSNRILSSIVEEETCPGTAEFLVVSQRYQE